MSNVLENKKIRIKLPKNHTADQWLISQYFEKFGSQEFIFHFNMEHFEWCKEWWKKNVTDCEDGIISQKDFQIWFYTLHKRRPNRFKKDDWPLKMISVAMVYGARTFEEAKDIKEKL